MLTERICTICWYGGHRSWARGYGRNVRVLHVNCGEKSSNSRVVLQDEEEFEYNSWLVLKGFIREFETAYALDSQSHGRLEIWRIALPTWWARFRKTSCLHAWWGPGGHGVGYVLRGGTIYNVVALFPDDGSVTEECKASATVEQLKKVYED